MSLLEQLNLSLNKIGSEGAQAGEGGTFSAESGSLHCVVQSTVLSCQDLQAKRVQRILEHRALSPRRPIQV